MDKLQELRQKLVNLKTEVRNLNNEGKVDEAAAKLEEMRKIQQQIDVEVALQEEEKRDLEAKKRKKEEEGRAKGSGKPKETSEFRSIVKNIMGVEMSDEERAAIKTSDNAAVIPDEFVNQLIEIQNGYGALKKYVDVITVTKNNGTIPVVDLEQNELLTVVEGDDITDGKLVTTDVKYTCNKIGLIQSLTSELLDDAEVEIESLVKKNFAVKATQSENARIMKVIKDNAKTVTATDYEDIEKTIDGAKPTVKAGLVTFCNTAGYVELKNKKDNEGRPLNLITVVNGVEMFHNKPIEIVDDSLVTLSEGKTQIFYVLNPKEAVKYIERKGVTVAKSTEAGFVDDTVKLRILERGTAVCGSSRSVSVIEL